MTTYTFESIKPEVEALRKRLNQLRLSLSRYFVAKDELIDLMVVCTLAQEPLLIVGPPGTAKSDLILKFVQAIGLEQGEYFEYMLTKFSEPSEIIGPVDINQLKEGRYLRRVDGKLPQCKVAFLDEIFKSNSAILNTLLTIINERKYYQDGQPVPVDLKMLFAATNEVPELAELGALRDRFTMKIESGSVMESHFHELLELGLANEGYKAFQQRPWEKLASLEDFVKLKVYLDHLMVRDQAAQRGTQGAYHDPFFPEPALVLFKRIIKTLQREDQLEISDRKVIKLYKLIRTRAFLFHGGEVTKDDLVLLRYIPDRLQDFAPVREKVDALLKLES
jgi:MoxR-like ATPase